MIGTGLKKLANENGMKVANGLAYGTFRGYSAAFWDGSGTKTMMLSTSIRDVDAKRPRRRRTTPAITAWVFWAHSLARCSARSSGR